MNILEYIKIIKRETISCGLLFALFFCGYAGKVAGQEASVKPVILYFRFDKALVDSGYMDNSRMLRQLDEWFTNRDLCANIDSVSIVSFASPEGDCVYNKGLAHQRSAAVKGYLAWKYPYLDQYRIHQYPEGENWQELRRLVRDDKNMPAREKVLEIIDCNKDFAQCKDLLEKLDNGVPYRYIYNRLLRYLRNATLLVWIRPGSMSILNKAAVAQTDIPAVLPIPCCPYPDKLGTSCGILPAAEKRRAHIKRPLFALKTNLLFDAALMPNVEMEVPIGRRWSVNGEYMFPWWLMGGGKYCFQILSGGLEGRYWLGGRDKRKRQEVLTGHFIGLFAGGGKFDLQWKENGYQGEFFIATGFSYGWATSIARNLRLEFNIGVGLLRTDYRHYHARNNYKVLQWQQNGRYTWLGPTKAKISLVWLLNRTFRKGGGI